MSRNWLAAIAAMACIILTEPALSRPAWSPATLSPPASSRPAAATADWWVVLTSNDRGKRGVYLLDKANLRVDGNMRQAELYLITDELVLENQMEFDCAGRRARWLGAWRQVAGGERRTIGAAPWSTVDDIPSLHMVFEFVCETEEANPNARSLGDVEPISAGRAFIKTGVVI